MNRIRPQCTGKQAFDSKRLAITVLERRGKKDKGARSVYRCEVCHKFHIGTSFVPKSEKDIRTMPKEKRAKAAGWTTT